LAPNIAARKQAEVGFAESNVFGAINRGDTQNTLKKARYKIRANAEEEEGWAGTNFSHPRSRYT
jgi:hypothetical protein